MKAKERDGSMTEIEELGQQDFQYNNSRFALPFLIGSIFMFVHGVVFILLAILSSGKDLVDPENVVYFNVKYIVELSFLVIFFAIVLGLILVSAISSTWKRWKGFFNILENISKCLVLFSATTQFLSILATSIYYFIEFSTEEIQLRDYRDITGVITLISMITLIISLLILTILNSVYSKDRKVGFVSLALFSILFIQLVYIFVEPLIIGSAFLGGDFSELTKLILITDSIWGVLYIVFGAITLIVYLKKRKIKKRIETNDKRN